MLPQKCLEEIHKFSGSYTCMNTFKGRDMRGLEMTMEFQMLQFFKENCLMFEQELWSMPEAAS